MGVHQVKKPPILARYLSNMHRCATCFFSVWQTTNEYAQANQTKTPTNDNKCFNPQHGPVWASAAPSSNWKHLVMPVYILPLLPASTNKKHIGQQKIIPKKSHGVTKATITFTAISNVTNNVTLKHCKCKWSHIEQFLIVSCSRCTDVCSKASCLFCCIIGFGILQSGVLRSGIKKNQPRLLLLPEPDSMLPWAMPNH